MKTFCVVINHPDRTWHDTVEDAVEFAKGLGEASYAHSQKAVTLHVVEIKQVIEVGRPTMTVRDPVEKDTIKSLPAAPAQTVIDEDDEDSPTRSRQAKRGK